MRVMRGIGIVLLVVGAAGYGAGAYIEGEVAKGKEQIAAGEEKLGQAKNLFSLMPQETGVVTQGVVKKGERQIGEGKEQIAYYEALAGRLEMGGIAAGILGLALLFVGKKKAKR